MPPRPRLKKSLRAIERAIADEREWARGSAECPR